MLQLLRGVSEDGSCPARLVIHVDERLALDAVVALPLDGEVSVGLFDVDGFGIPIPCQGRGEPILLIEQPGIPRLRREQDKLPDRNDSSVVSGCTPSNVAYLIGETEILDVLHALARSTPNGSSGGGHGTLHQAVRRSSRLRLSLLRSHCHPRLPERPFAARAGGALLPPDCRRSGHQQEVLSQRTADYQKWVEAFARNRNIPIEWAE